MGQINPLKVFSTRAANYQYRPRYPRELLELIRQHCGLKPDHIIADLASGTGFLTGLLLQNRNRVYAIEPNDEMRHIAEESFISNPYFVSLEGTAEHIPLPDGSVDLVTVGQALHWLEVNAARIEMLRILKPGGWVVIVDNVLDDDGSVFMRAYDKFRRQYFTYIGTAADPPEKIVHLFKDVQVEKHIIPITFECDAQAFRNGILSSSTAPQPGSPGFDDFDTVLHQLFTGHQMGGKLEILFNTVAWLGQLKPDD